MATDGPRPTPALALSGVEKGYDLGLLRGRRRVLRGLDLELEPGGALGLVGPNGSGKSTLLRIAAGIELPSAGSASVFGLDPRREEARRRTGYLPETSPYPRELTAARALDLLGSLSGMSRAERRRRAAELLRRVGLEAEAGRALGAFSQGMLRRFGLAQACLHAPDLLLLDEPTAGLDARGFGVLDELVTEARERGAALVLCSHVTSDVLRHCDRVLVLVDGRAVADGAPATLAREGDGLLLEIEGLEEHGRRELEAALAAAGARVVASGPSSRTLIRLYGEPAQGGKDS